MRARLRPRPPRWLAAFARSRRGVIAMMVAIGAPILFGSAALVVDANYWFTQHAAAQTAADAAAFAAARDQAAGFASSMQADGIAAARNAAGNVYGFAAASASVLPATSPVVTITSTSSGATAVASIPHLLAFGPPFGGLIGKPGLTKGVVQSIATVSLGGPASDQQICYAADSYSATFSPGVFALDLDTTSGVDPVSCGLPKANAAKGISATELLANPGVTATSNNVISLLDNILFPHLYSTVYPAGPLGNDLTGALGQIIGIGNLLPYAYTPFPASLSTASASGLNSWISTIANVLTLNTNCLPAYAAAHPTYVSANYVSPNINCTGNSCTVMAAQYCGDVVFAPNLTLAFKKSTASTILGLSINLSGLGTVLSNLSNAIFPIRNGQIVFQDTDAIAPSSATCATTSLTCSDPYTSFFFWGEKPGGVLVENQTVFSFGNVQTGAISVNTSTGSISATGATGTLAMFSTPGASTATAAMTSAGALGGLKTAVANEIGQLGAAVNNLLPNGNVLGLAFQSSVANCPTGSTTCGSFPQTLSNCPDPTLTCASPAALTPAPATITQYLFPNVPTAAPSSVNNANTTTATLVDFSYALPKVWQQSTTTTATATIGGQLATALNNAPSHCGLLDLGCILLQTLSSLLSPINSLLSSLNLPTLASTTLKSLTPGAYSGQYGSYLGVGATATGATVSSCAGQTSLYQASAPAAVPSIGAIGLLDASSTSGATLNTSINVCGALINTGQPFQPITAGSSLTASSSGGPTAFYISR